ncbi:BlaR1 peptidase M56 [Singulisphaera sp. GP187]|uniref:M56 family metallopeptidase n=1 Tax=Singulisphaera sp. GP187 TaxID=1882752 RepID=UPI0009299B7D|nr:M56 family metallopeptidase [Singulisphaera sp. GP187]SIO13733.1 BlaR1 peptidase M56 [Singulisphaera sp. GP187]
MNDLGGLLVEATARVTALAAVGVALVLLLRRRGPAAGVLVTMTTLLGLVAVSVSSLSPWPRFWSIDVGTTAPSAPRSDVAVSRPLTTPTVVPEAPKSPQVSDTRLNDFAREFVRDLQSLGIRPVPEAASRWQWPAWFAAALLAASGLGIARLALALRAVASLRRGSRPIADARLCDEVERLRLESGCSRPVELRATDDLTTPATIGWRRPVLLLPSDWRDWDEHERRAVLAHELGHIHRGDYMLGLWAQVCLAVHVYHPLAHWLAARLRLEQELAADAWGARLSGGNRPYLEALARLALRRSGTLESSLAAWPARPFLPTRGTLLRRIDMLREADPNPLRTHALPLIGRVLTVAALAVVGLLVAGIRGPATTALAQQKATRLEVAVDQVEPDDAGTDVFDLSHAPVNTMMAVVGKPAEILRRPEFQPVAALLNDPHERLWAGSPNLKADEVESMTVLILRAREGGGTPGTPNPPTVILHSTKPQDWKAVAKSFVKRPEVVQFDGSSYTRSMGAPNDSGVFTPDDRTIVIGSEDALKQVITSRKGGPSRHAWDGAWSRVKKGQIAFAFDPIWVLAQMGPGVPSPLFDGIIGLFPPLLDSATAYAVGLDSDNGLGLDLVATCSSDDGTKRVSEMLQAVITLAKNALPGLRREVLAQPDPTRESSLRLFGLAEQLLANARTEVVGDNRVVSLHARSDGDLAGVVPLFLTAGTASRSAARRAQSQNNLKQLLLAMHNYADTHGHLPPAVIRPDDGKPPYSWRVAILPFIDQNDLFKKYNFNEPWDSVSNRKLIEKMPAIYRYPSDESGNNAYFVVTGEPTLFPPGNPGVKFAEVFDGLSNTIMVVEAKREIPWTKPEDLAYDPAKPMPEFGGFTKEGGNSGFADGSVRFISTRLDPQLLKALLSRAGGEVVRLNDDHSNPIPATLDIPTQPPTATPLKR